MWLNQKLKLSTSTAATYLTDSKKINHKRNPDTIIIVSGLLFYMNTCFKYTSATAQYRG